MILEEAEKLAEEERDVQCGWLPWDCAWWGVGVGTSPWGELEYAAQLDSCLTIWLWRTQKQEGQTQLWMPEERLRLCIALKAVLPAVSGYLILCALLSVCLGAFL